MKKKYTLGVVFSNYFMILKLCSGVGEETFKVCGQLMAVSWYPLTPVDIEVCRCLTPL